MKNATAVMTHTFAMENTEVIHENALCLNLG